MSFLRKVKVRGHLYVYELENYYDADGKRRQRVVRYIGPVAPIYGNRGPVNFREEVRKHRERRRLWRRAMMREGSPPARLTLEG